MIGLLEATDPNAPARRAAAARRAGVEVASSARTIERDAVQVLLRRLQQLKRELQGIIATAGATEFRRFTAGSLIADVDRLIADATKDLTNGTRGVFSSAAGAGADAVDQPLSAARIALQQGPRIDAPLVTRAFDLTADLLTEPMQQFRNQVVRGIRRATLLGDSASQQLQSLARSIDKAGFDAAAFKAERILRTETTRVLNEATYGRMLVLADSMPFLRKGWRSAKDNRTRTGHLEASQTYARGNGIPIRQPFKINVHQEARLGAGGVHVAAKLLGTVTMRFPVDPLTAPEGRLAAAATIMCRCGAFVDLDLAALKAWSTSRSLAISPGAPAPEPERGFAEPPIAPAPPRRLVPTMVRPKPVPVPPMAIARVEPVASVIPGGRDLLTGYSAEVGTALEAAYTELLDASRFDQAQSRWREALQTVTKKGARGALHIGGGDYVVITEAVGADIAASEVWIHTHPSGTAFSFADVVQFARFNDGRMRMLVFGNYGTWHELQATLEQLPQHDQPTALPRIQAMSDEFNAEYRQATIRARARTSAALPEMARAAGVSVGQFLLSREGDSELQTLHLLHGQEETVEMWTRLAAKWGMTYRSYLPPAGTTNPRHRSTK